MPIFNEAQVEGFAKAGERIGGILQDRWWKKEAENFQQSEMRLLERSQKNLEMLLKFEFVVDLMLSHQLLFFQFSIFTSSK